MIQKFTKPTFTDIFTALNFDIYETEEIRQANENFDDAVNTMADILSSHTSAEYVELCKSAMNTAYTDGLSAAQYIAFEIGVKFALNLLL